MLKSTFALILALALAPACAGSSKQTATPEPTPVAETPVTPETPPVAEQGGGQLTEEQCNAALDHAIELFRADPNMAGVADEIAAEKPTHVQECMKTGTQKDYDCLMAAATPQDLGNCEEPSEHE